ncbi:hypothetical protein T11_3779 [Trichinella zimbabwensis]|uniref:Uncharacterized protein n=1 Tax=Trichinella zimbabwensis TaxID=268475 RepID=A0A0V1GAR7_9BILA|nr:hypothetical protein T11_3779 [Trichinella zimbabwensis]
MTFYRPDRPQADRACSATGRGQPLSMRGKHRTRYPYPMSIARANSLSVRLD